jgi:hypothetical protein
MQIGSNNSFSYLSHDGWWNILTKWFSQYQTKDYKKQYLIYGIRTFDVGLAVNKQGRLVLRYDGNTYNFTHLYEAFDYFNKQGDVRVNVFLDESFEERMNDNNEEIIRKFKEFCHNLEFMFPDIIFYGGYRKFDMKQIYTFNKKEDDEIEIVNINDVSKFYSIVTRVFPFMRKRLNDKYKKKYEGKRVILLLNYIEER